MLGNTEKEIGLRPASAKSTLFGILLVVVAIFVYVFFVKTLKVDIGQLEADLLTQNAELEKIVVELKKADEAQKSLNLASTVEKTQSLKAVPEAMQQDEVIRDLITIARVYDITLKSISFSKGSGPRTDVGGLRVSASFEGNYLDLTSFLQGLEENDRLFKVESISVQIGQLALSDIERANFSLSMLTYFQQ